MMRSPIASTHGAVCRLRQAHRAERRAGIFRESGEQLMLVVAEDGAGYAGTSTSACRSPNGGCA